MTQSKSMFDEVEDPRTSVSFAAVSGLGLFIDAVKATPFYGRLRHAVKQDDRELSRLECRTKELLGAGALPNTRSRYDFAVAVYLLVLDETAKDQSLAIAEEIAKDRTFWWAKQIAAYIAAGVHRRTVTVLSVANVDQNLLTTEDVESVAAGITEALNVARDDIVVAILKDGGGMHRAARTRKILSTVQPNVGLDDDSAADASLEIGKMVL